MRRWFHKYRVTASLLCAALALAITEGVLLLYYLDSWLTLPLL